MPYLLQVLTGTEGWTMQSESELLCVGILTDDPVACRVLRLLLRSAGYDAECMCPKDGLVDGIEGVDLLVVGQGMGAVYQQIQPRAGLQVLRLLGDGEADPAQGPCLPWPSPRVELVRAIEAIQCSHPRAV